MRGRSLLVRVVLGMVLVSLLSSLALAVTAALTTRVLWSAWHRQALEETADAFIRTMHIEAVEDRISLDKAAREAMEESALTGYRFEVWREGTLLSSNSQGNVLGLGEQGSPAEVDGWLLCQRQLPGQLTLVLGYPEAQGFLARRVFTRSLLISLPTTLLLAVLIGWLVGHRTTSPLVEFTQRVSHASGLEPIESSSFAVVPSEIHDLEMSFRKLHEHLTESLAREIEFAANASHELRTPLTSIRLNAERALQDAGPQARTEIYSLLAEIDRMVRLIDSLLVMAKGSDETLRLGDAVNLCDLTRDVVKRLSPDSLPSSLNLPDEALVRGDERLLAIAIENLIDNARKFKAPGRDFLAVLTEESALVKLTVTSPGVRIPDEARNKLFDRFYRDPVSRSRSAGHGLGLPLARHIARLHGGDLRYGSGPGEDASFVLVIPAWRPAAVRAPARPPAASPRRSEEDPHEA